MNSIQSRFLIFQLPTLIMLLAIIFSGCDRSRVLEQSNILYGKVKSLVEIEYKLHYRFDEFQKDKPSAIRYYWFDEKTNLVKKKEISAYPISDSIFYNYDGKSRLIKEIDFFNGKKSTIVYSYNELNLISSIRYLNDSVVEKVMYEFSDSQKKRKETHYIGNSQKIVISKFDENGNKISESYFNIDGQKEKEFSFEYNNRCLLLKSSERSASGEQFSYDNKNLLVEKKDAFSTSNYEYKKFDKHDNWVEQEYYIKYSDEGYRYRVERIITYY